MKRQYLVLDLETVTDTTLPPPPKKADGTDVFPSAPYHRIVVMGAALLDAACRLRSIWIVAEGMDEFAALAALITFLNAMLAKGIETTIVSWNGRGFDLPVIVARCLRYGIAFPRYYQQRNARHRYTVDGHFDLMDYLVDHGATKSYSLDVAARLIGMPGKLDVHGADVAAMIDAGRIDDVRAYCMQDVAQTAAIFLRVQLLRGELTPEGYVEAMEGLLSTVEREPRLAALMPGIDRKRLLLTGAGAPAGKAA